MREIIPVVNDKDRIIGYKNRSDILPNDIYRVSALWITNSKGDILLAQRSLTKKNDPGMWGPAVAGTVSKGITYKKTITKEAHEEIGLDNIIPKKGPKIQMSNEHVYFVQWYFLKINKNINEFIIDREEVRTIKWFTRQELKKELKNNPKIFPKRIKILMNIF